MNHLYCVRLPGYTWQSGLKHTEINLQTLQDKDMVLLLENYIGGDIGSVLVCSYVKSDEIEKIINVDAFSLYVWDMIESLPYDEIEMWHGHPDLNMFKLEEILKTPDISDIGSSIEVDSRYPDDIKKNTKYFPFCPGNKVIPKDKYIDYLEEMKRKNHKKSEKLKCDWTDKKNCLFYYKV